MGFFGSKPKVPQLQRVNLADQQRQAVDESMAIAPKTEELASRVNQFQSAEMQRLMESAFPTFGAIRDRLAGNAAALAAGEIPTDVSGAVQRSAAARALGGGFGGTGAGRALTARDLGRTSLDLQQQGLANFAQLSAITQPLVPRPFDVTSMFVSPLQRATFENEQNLQQFQRDWMQAQISAQPHTFAPFVQDIIGTIVKTGLGLGTMGLAGSMFGGDFGSSMAQGLGQGIGSGITSTSPKFGSGWQFRGS